MPPRPVMPLFVDPQDVILRMQLSPDLSGIDEVLRSGITAAQLHVERIIDGKLARRSQNALYFIDAESFSGIAPGGAYRLEIPSGLVRQDVVQSVETSTNPSASPFGDYEPIQSDLMRFDYDRGYLYLDQQYGNYHVRVQCDTGYEDGTRALPPDDLDLYSPSTAYVVGDQVSYTDLAYECYTDVEAGVAPSNPTYWKLAYVPQEPLPDPIYEAIMSLVPMVFNAQQTTNRSKEAKDQYQTLTDHANLLLQPYTRTAGFTFRTLFGHT